MNLKRFLTSLLVLLLFFQCKKMEDCTNIHEPVCGGDGYDYPNKCYARQMGVDFTEGYCTFTSKGIILNNQCGWVIQLDSFVCYPHWKIFYKPEIPMELQEHGLKVEIRHTRFSDGIPTCFQFEDEDLSYGLTGAKLISIIKI